MRVTVTQFSDGTPEDEWTRLIEHVAEIRPDLVVLGEMPFDRWLAASDAVDENDWAAAVARHEEWMARLGELGGAAVAASRPISHGGTPHNEGFTWTARGGPSATHIKYYLPDEPGFWEASWYRRSPQRSFHSASIARATCGFMLCTDMWFTEHARSYAAQGVELLLVPRATPAATGAKWLAGGRAAAVMAGAFCLSSNRQGSAEGVLFGGSGWVIDPEGNVLAVTTAEDPHVTVEIDLAEARAAKKTYPRYVAE
ncbi:MAG: carbon-nitrogen hydrolase family protein [bacterium]|nr:carbon-nitrogen hydrolase family protein [bacterium]